MTAKQSHTLGPWSGGKFCPLCGAHGSEWWEGEVPDQKIYAAAPKLLEALRVVREYRDIPSNIMDVVKDALAKVQEVKP